MSLDGYLFFNRNLASIAEWQKAIDAAGFPLTLASDRDLGSKSGHLPAWWNGRDAGFECGPCDVAGVLTTYEEIDFGGPWQHAMAFHFGTLASCAGAWMAMAAYALATGGVAFDPQDGVVLNGDCAVNYARDGAEAFPRLEAMFADQKSREAY